MKLFNRILFAIAFMAAGFANAGQPTPAEFEVPALSMKLSNDGTGIINKVTCGGCDYNFVKITSKTRAYVNGKSVELFRARERAGKPVFIQFVRATGEVVSINWSE